MLIVRIPFIEKPACDQFSGDQPHIVHSVCLSIGISIIRMTSWLIFLIRPTVCDLFYGSRRFNKLNRQWCVSTMLQLRREINLFYSRRFWIIVTPTALNFFWSSWCGYVVWWSFQITIRRLWQICILYHSFKRNGRRRYEGMLAGREGEGEGEGEGRGEGKGWSLKKDSRMAISAISCMVFGLI